MSQRHSGYLRRLAEDYPTPDWASLVVIPFLPPGVTLGWDPAQGEGAMVLALNRAGLPTVWAAGVGDFLEIAQLPSPDINAIITSPPYGHGGQLARQFIEHALELVPVVAMLLRVDFDSGRTRQHLFRNCPAFACKLTLLDRIEWFPGEYRSSTNHAWFVWNEQHRGPPTIAYAGKADVAARQAAAEKEMRQAMDAYTTGGLIALANLRTESASLLRKVVGGN
jgi:hypothetical protein